MNSIRSLFLLIVVTLLLFSCSYDAAGTASEIPNPVHRSIIPLKAHNRGTYQVTMYDDSGTSIIYSDTIRSYISEPYAYSNDSLIPYYDYYTNTHVLIDDTTKILYPFGWMSDKNSFYPTEGYLLWHREATDTSPSALEVHGVFTMDTTIFWKDTSYKWLLYPAQSGTQWNKELPGNEASQFTIIGTEEKKFLTSAIPHNCYVYKENKGELNTYHYYHPDIGLVASLDFKNGKRVRAVHIIMAESYIYTQ